MSPHRSDSDSQSESDYESTGKGHREVAEPADLSYQEQIAKFVAWFTPDGFKRNLEEVGGWLQIKNDLLSGIAVAIAQVPEAVSFAFVANVAPIHGLYAAFMIGLFTSLFGGRPGMISGATGALAVVYVEVTEANNRTKAEGTEWLFFTLIWMGLFEIAAGVLRLGKFITLISHPIMIGFVNGLAIVIFRSQLGSFKEGTGIFDANGDEIKEWLEGKDLGIMLAYVFGTMFIMLALPLFTKAVPSSLVAILIITGINAGLNDDDKNQTVRDFAGEDGISGSAPEFFLPLEGQWTSDNIVEALPHAGVFAAIGLIESLMTLTLIDDLTNTKGNPNREAFGQGIANLFNGFFQGMGGCAMIGQSMININSGGRLRLSGVVAAMSVLLFIVAVSEAIAEIPMGVLTGIMMVVVIKTFDWSSLFVLHKIPLGDSITIILVVVVTVIKDLAIAVGIGIVWQALVFSWESSRHIQVDKEYSRGKVIYHLRGPLFFGSCVSFSKLFDPANDPSEVILDFKRAPIHDHSGFDAVTLVVEKYTEADKVVTMRHLSDRCRRILKRAGNLVEHIPLDEDLRDHQKPRSGLTGAAYKVEHAIKAMAYPTWAKKLYEKTPTGKSEVNKKHQHTAPREHKIHADELYDTDSGGELRSRVRSKDYRSDSDGASFSSA